MKQISAKLAARFRASSKYRRPIRDEAKRLLESGQFLAGPQDVGRCPSELDPLHATYAAMQNVASHFTEVISVLDELEPFCRIQSAADEEYMPLGPPMSPLTNSYFSTWSLFDLQFGPDKETIGTCLLDTGSALGLTPEMLEVTERFQNSRMGLYEHCGRDGDKVRLRELLTEKVCVCHPTSGYVGNEGELWYVRLCPPVLGLADYHVSVTTPYVLLASKADWIVYLKRQLLGAADLSTSLHEFFKHGRTLNQWNEFIFLAYHHHQPTAVFLTGIPDVQTSLPHANRPGQL